MIFKCLFTLGNEKFIFVILFFSSQSLSSDLELECFGESDLPNLHYGKEILGESWYFGLDSKTLGFYFSLNESKKTGSVRFIGFMNNQTVQKNKSIPLSNLDITKGLISAKVKIDIDRKFFWIFFLFCAGVAIFFPYFTDEIFYFF